MSGPAVVREGNNETFSIVSEPRRYGFHATLKPPFRLARGRKVEELEQALSSFARKNRACPLGPLKLSTLRGFLALVPVLEIPRLQAFASSIVEIFDPFRAPFNEAELQRRLSDHLDDDETTHLVRWGYPYVFNRFAFHMTLTNRIESDQQAEVRARLRKRLAALLAEDYHIDALTLFEQRGPNADARARFPLGQGTFI